MPRSPDSRLWHAKVASLATSACRNFQSGDFAMPKARVWRLWHGKVARMATLAWQSRQTRDLGMAKSPVWRLCHAKVARHAKTRKKTEKKIEKTRKKQKNPENFPQPKCLRTSGASHVHVCTPVGLEKGPPQTDALKPLSDHLRSRALSIENPITSVMSTSLMLSYSSFGSRICSLF